MSNPPTNAHPNDTLNEGTLHTAAHGPTHSNGGWPEVTAPVSTLDDEALLAALSEVVGHERRSLVRILVLLIEVEDRRLHAEYATPSMFDFCVQKLGYSESEAYRRISVARLSKAFPEVLDALIAGRISLTNASLVAKLITAANVTRVLEDISGKTRRQVEGYVVRHRPKADVPDSLRRLASAPPTTASPVSSDGDLAEDSGSTGGDRTSNNHGGEPVVPPVGGRIEALSPDRFGIRFTIDATTCAKLDRAIALLSHQNPNRNYAVVLERALDALLAKLEKQRFATTNRPRKAAPPKDEATIPAATKREVVERDGERCAWVDKHGDRCTATDFLEFDHIDPKAQGGSGRDASRVRMLCRAHNRHAADRTFGRQFMDERVRAARDGRATRKAAQRDPELAPDRRSTERLVAPAESPSGVTGKSRPATGEPLVEPNDGVDPPTTDRAPTHGSFEGERLDAEAGGPLPVESRRSRTPRACPGTEEPAVE